MSIAFFKGTFVSLKEANINIRTHAFNYGTGVFEGIRGYYCENQKQMFLFRVEDHYERMRKNSRIVHIDIERSSEELIEITKELIKRNNFKCDIYIRPIAYKSAGKLGVSFPRDHELCIYIIETESVDIPDKPVRSCVSSWRRTDDNMIPGSAKITGAYVNSALAATEARDNGFDEALLLNQDGHVSEASTMNLFMLKNKMLCTPATSHNILPGITRDSVIEMSRRELDLDTIERPISRTELYFAEEVFLCSTMREILSVGSIDNKTINGGEIGGVTKQLQTLFHEIVRAKNKKFKKWLTPVY